jgi:CBS domain containing-hemolysin-like protein
MFSALFSGVEMAFVSSDRVRAGLDAHKGGVVSRILNRYFSDPDFFISTILVGNNIMLVVYGMGAAALLEPWLEGWCPNEALILVMQTLISTAVILIVGEFMPKAMFRINPNSSLRIVAVPIYLFYIVLYPVSLFTTWLSKVLMRVCGIQDTSVRKSVMSIVDLNTYIERSIDEQELTTDKVENEVKIFHNAVDFSTTHLRDCMIPRNEIVAVNIDTATRDELKQLFTSTGRSKIIVYRDDIDNVEGYIHVSELFHLDKDWKESLKPVVFAPESLLANKMMRRLLGEKRSVAIVVDEFGGTSGMVTLEDLVEEIFGDIEDEHDNSHLTARMISDGKYEFSGRIEIGELHDRFGIDIPEDDEYQTLAGYILFKTGTIPAVGDEVDIDGLKFKILKSSATRLELISLTLPEESEA